VQDYLFDLHERNLITVLINVADHCGLFGFGHLKSGTDIFETSWADCSVRWLFAIKRLQLGSIGKSLAA
jgi:hypothetical protein